MHVPGIPAQKLIDNSHRRRIGSSQRVKSVAHSFQLRDQSHGLIPIERIESRVQPMQALFQVVHIHLFAPEKFPFLVAQPIDSVIDHPNEVRDHDPNGRQPR